MSDHIADAEAIFVVVNVTPDFCRVGKQVVPFEIVAVMSAEHSNYSPNTFSRGEKVLRLGSVIRGTQGNMGTGVLSGVAQGKGHAVATSGAPTVCVNGKAAVRHGDVFSMNGTA